VAQNSKPIRNGNPEAEPGCNRKEKVHLRVLLTAHLQEEIARAKSKDDRRAIMVCDLDGFKRVNDGFGRLRGNEVWGIWGGDEFVTMVQGMAVGTDVEALRNVYG